LQVSIQFVKINFRVRWDIVNVLLTLSATLVYSGPTDRCAGNETIEALGESIHPVLRGDDNFFNG
jgi:hypothetical protein